jgi:hypothetical protein
MIGINSPVIANLRAHSSSIVLGCPGVPRSVPRVETVVEIRSVGGKPFELRSVSVELRTIQKVSVPSTIGSNDTTREFLVYKDPLAYRPPIGEFYQELLGTDIPVLIPLPKDIISSGRYPHWNAQTAHFLYVQVSCGKTIETEINYGESFPIVIKLYDTLPLYRQFNEPVIEIKESFDRRLVIETTIPHSSVGPKDEFMIIVKVMTNSLSNNTRRNIRLNKLTLQIKEILECHEGGLAPRKEFKIFTTSKEYPQNNIINTSGLIEKFQFPFPGRNDYLESYSNKNTHNGLINSSFKNPEELLTIQSINISRDNLIEKLDEGIPLTHTQGFTTMGKLFSIRYEINLKFRFSRAKDIEIRLPLTISPYDRKSSEYLLNWIMNQCETARTRMGPNVVNQIAGPISYEAMVPIINRFKTPPIIYRYSRSDWVRLGYSEEAFGKKGKHAVQYID